MSESVTDQITVYSSPTCPWCHRAKELLHKQGAPFREVDVSTNRQAGAEILRRTGQMGVPVITDAEEAIVGYDVPRLQRMAARHVPRPGLGVRIKDAEDGSGAYVGSVRPGSPGAKAGIEVGDVIDELAGAPVRNAADLERLGRQRRSGQPTSTAVRRNGERRTLIIPG